MVVARLDPSRHAELLERVFDLPRHGLTPDRAAWLLELDFPDADQKRVERLNEKANEGTLVSAERAELEAYANIAELLAYWQSQARQYLRPRSRFNDTMSPGPRS